MDSKQQEQQVDRQFREEGEEEWEDEGGEEEELVAHARELDFGAHCLPCQGDLFFSSSTKSCSNNFVINQIVIFCFSSWDQQRLISQRGLKL